VRIVWSAPLASASQPDREPLQASGSFTDTSLCGFPIKVSYQVSGYIVNFFNQAGDQVREQIHAAEQDTFTAHGTTLVGDRYVYNLQARVSPTTGELLSQTSSGQLAKVRLPDGSLFMGAGRVDLLSPHEGLITEPDNGVSKNHDAFCSALSG
jgi:hypothetical protein